MAALSSEVQSLGYQFFTCSALPCDKDSGLHLGKCVDQGIYLLHRFAFADDAVKLSEFCYLLYQFNHPGVIMHNQYHATGLAL